MSNRHFRFQAAKWFPLSLENFSRFEIQEETEEVEEVILAGLGGIGSWLSLLLSRVLTQETELILFDPDHYEDVNMAGQFVKGSQIGLPKTSVAVENMKDFSNYTNVTVFQDLYTSDSDVSPIMICGFDNMEARQIFYNNWKSQEDRIVFIDGRLSAEFYQVFCIYNKKAEEEYEKEWLYLEEGDLIQEDCSFKQTSHFAAGIASEMTRLLTKTLSPFAAPAPNFVGFNFNTYKYDIQYFRPKK